MFEAGGENANGGSHAGLVRLQHWTLQVIFAQPIAGKHSCH